MRILDKVQQVFDQYDLKPIELPVNCKDVYMYLRAYPEFKKDFQPSIVDGDLNMKYRPYVPKGWYGFDIGSPIVPAWMEIIDKIVALCIEADPNFEIHQVKLKYGGIRFYTGSNIIEDLHEVESLISVNLFDGKLIY